MTATTFWDEHYRTPRTSRVNPLLAEIAGDLPPAPPWTWPAEPAATHSG